jgi:hypothetical protein
MQAITPSMKLGLALLCACLLASGCSVDDGEDDEQNPGGGAGAYNPVIDPARFVALVSNPLFPLVPGTTWTYDEGEKTVVVRVLAETKQILGVTCTVVRDTVTTTMDGALVEDTTDWYAQDMDGAVWYMGEETAEYENGIVVSTHGSWEAGVAGAKPGLIIPAHPTVGHTHKQEYFVGEAEDEATVLAVDATASVPFGEFASCLQTHDFTRLDPSVNEQKYYAPGVGLVLAVDMNSGEREELVSREAQ